MDIRLPNPISITATPPTVAHSAGEPTGGQAALDRAPRPTQTNFKQRNKYGILLARALWAVPLVVLVGLVLIERVGLIDDSYIFLRYARNAAEGLGPVFNAGERVEGFSSPLWMLLLATAASLAVDLESVAWIGGVCFAGLSVVVVALAMLGVPHSRRETDIVLLLALATSPLVVFAAGSGMDSPLFLFCVTAALVSMLGDQTNKNGVSCRTSIFLLLALLARSEGALLVGYCGLASLVQQRSVRRLWLVAVGMALLLIVRYGYYGDWVPNTAYAKIAFFAAQRWMNGCRYVAEAALAHGPTLLVAAVSVLWSMRKTGEHRRRLVLLGGWIVLYTGYVIYVGGDNIPGWRFLLPIVPAMVLLCHAAVAIVRSYVCAEMWRRAVLVTTILLTASNILAYRSLRDGYYANMSLAKAWSDVGRWLERTTPPDTVIATPAIGAIGYFGKRTTVDMLGLTDRTVATQGQVYGKGAHGHARYHTDYLYERSPDLVVYMSSGRFEQPKYSLPQRIPKDFGFALYDFATDGRCELRYEYVTVPLPNGRLVEMLQKRGFAYDQLASGY